MIDRAPSPTFDDETPGRLCAADVQLPELYTRVLELGWEEIPPWTFLHGERLNEVQRQLDEVVAGESLVPFAIHEQRGTVACFRGRSAPPQVVTLRPRLGLDSFSMEPSFDVWLREAWDAWVASETPGPARERGPLPLPLAEPPRDVRSTTRRHLMRVLRENEVDLEFVEAEAGDRPLGAYAERRHHDRVRRERGERLYADMLFVLTQHRYPDRMARWLWGRILAHKRELAAQLGRDVQVTVASLDFLTQHTHLVDGSLVLCSESELSQVADVALRDGLTGLFDQATFKVRLQRELERTTRYASPLSLLLLDLDRFKALNDEHGHLVGDEVLAEVGAILCDEARAVDVPARYGGEEFAILLPETPADDAEILAERIRRAVEVRFAGTLDVTISCGVAAAPEDGCRPDELIESADQALYRAKANGRNRVDRASAWPPAACPHLPPGAVPAVSPRHA